MIEYEFEEYIDYSKIKFITRYMSAKDMIQAERLKLKGWKVADKNHTRDTKKYKYKSVSFDLFYIEK